MKTLRQALHTVLNVQDSARHAGLWLDKYLESSHRDDTHAKRDLLKTISGLQSPTIYQIGALARWQRMLEHCGASVYKATAKTPLVIGLGGASVLETHFTIHRTYGVPYLPGSALKGLASSCAHQHFGNSWAKDGEDHNIAFGSAEQAGYVTFFDALPENYTFHPDVMTPHHPDYYQGNKPPTDWDSPTPIPYLSCTGTFLVALSGPKVWVEQIVNILDFALQQRGIGAKTSSGYGRMAIADAPHTRQARKQEKQAKQQGAIKDFKRSLTLQPQTIANDVQKLKDAAFNQAETQTIAQYMLERVHATFKQKQLYKNDKPKPWYRMLQTLAGSSEDASDG